MKNNERPKEIVVRLRDGSEEIYKVSEVMVQAVTKDDVVMITNCSSDFMLYAVDRLNEMTEDMRYLEREERIAKTEDILFNRNKEKCQECKFKEHCIVLKHKMIDSGSTMAGVVLDADLNEDFLTYLTEELVESNPEYKKMYDKILKKVKKRKERNPETEFSFMDLTKKH